MPKDKSSYKKLIVNFVIVVLMCNYVLASPMLYKRNPDDKYERVSSTVIPLTVLEVSYGLGGKPSEEYKEAYLKKLRRKVQHEKSQGDINEDPDTLITIKKKFKDVNGEVKVKNIIIAPKSGVDASKH